MANNIFLGHKIKKAGQFVKDQIHEIKWKILR